MSREAVCRKCKHLLDELEERIRRVEEKLYRLEMLLVEIIEMVMNRRNLSPNDRKQLEKFLKILRRASKDESWREEYD